MKISLNQSFFLILNLHLNHTVETQSNQYILSVCLGPAYNIQLKLLLYIINVGI